MKRPQWTKQLMFSVSWGPGIPKAALDMWEENLKFLNELLVKNSISLVHVYLHWHNDPDLIHYCGVTYLDEKRMAFCQGNDKETMLHEVAHLMVKFPEHNEKWADVLLQLHAKYLKGTELRNADAELCKDYTKAVNAYRERYKKEPPKSRKRRRATEEEPEVL